MNNKNKISGDNGFAIKIKSLREKKGWKQDKLASEARISQPEISKIENGTIRVSEDIIEALADALEVSPEILIRNTSYASGLGIHPLTHAGNSNQTEPIVSYFASALTGLEPEQIQEIIELDERVKRLCENYFNYSVALYRPRLKTSPTDNPDFSSREVYEIDQERVASSDLIFLATIFPSLGAGMELQIALQSCTSIILIKKKDQTLSRMVLGCPTITRIVEYNDLEELDIKLVEAMNDLLPDISELRLNHPQQAASFDLGNRIKQLRLQRNYKEEQLARLIGVDVSFINSLENKSEHIVNPSLEIIRRIAKVFMTSEAYLISGQHVDSTFVEHSDALRNYAGKENMSVRELNELWFIHENNYEKDLSVVGAKNRAEIGTEKYWEEQHKQLKKQNEKGGTLPFEEK